MTTSLFGIEWENIYDKFSALSGIAEHIHQEIGRFFISNNISALKQEDWYKIIALIHERTILGEPYFISSIEGIQYGKMVFANSKENITFCTMEECFSDFPNNILEIQKRSLMLLYKKHPKYGYMIQDIKPYELFSETNNDCLFIRSGV